MNETLPEQVYETEMNSDEPNDETSAEFFAKLVGLSEVVAITGRNKGRISLDTNSGKLPFTLNEKGQKRYKVSDLLQIYGFKNPNETSLAEIDKPTETAPETALLQERLHAQSETMRRMEEEIRDLRQTRDRLLDQTQRLTLLLPAPTTAAPEPVSAAPAKKSLWQRLFT